MPTRLPPRREPRVLALARGSPGLLWAIADPWELRGTGVLKCALRAETLMVRRLIRREKPTAVVTRDVRLGRKVDRVAQGARVPFLAAPASLPPRPIASELYPELLLFAPGRAMQRVATLAIAAVLHSPLTSRRYASRRHFSAPRSA